MLLIQPKENWKYIEPILIEEGRLLSAKRGCEQEREKWNLGEKMKTAQSCTELIDCSVQWQTPNSYVVRTKKSRSKNEYSQEMNKGETGSNIKR